MVKHSAEVMKAIPEDDRAAEGLMKLECDSNVSSTTYQGIGFAMEPKK